MEWGTLIGVIVGGILGGGGQIVHSSYQRFSDMRNLAASIGGEIAAIAELIKRRGFVSELERWCEQVGQNPQETVEFSNIVAITVGAGYFEIFSANTERIGLMGPHSKDVAYFYTLAKGAVDINATLKRYEEALLKKEQLTVHHESLLPLYTGLLHDLKELLALSDQLLPRLQTLSSRGFAIYLFRGEK
jgi:hypothetical protein